MPAVNVIYQEAAGRACSCHNPERIKRSHMIACDQEVKQLLRAMLVSHPAVHRNCE